MLTNIDKKTDHGATSEKTTKTTVHLLEILRLLNSVHLLET